MGGRCAAGCILGPERKCSLLVWRDRERATAAAAAAKQSIACRPKPTAGKKRSIFRKLATFRSPRGLQGLAFFLGPSSERLQLCGGARAVSRRVRAKGSATAARLQPRHQAAAAPAAPAALAQIPPVIPHSPLFSTRHRRRRVSRARCAVDSGACKGGGCCCGCGCGCFFGGRPIGSHSRTRA